MGSGGMSSRLSRGSVSLGGTIIQQAPQPTPPQAQPPQQQNNIQNQTPNAQNTPVNTQALQQLTQMSDSQLAALVQQAKNTQLPNNLNDSYDITQNFTFVAGLNQKPIVLQDASFNQYLKDNNLTSKDLLSRNVKGATFTVNGVTFKYTAEDITKMMKYSRLNYIGGKQGGQLYGAGTYFAHSGGKSTGYAGSGARTTVAVLNPNTAKPIEYDTLVSKAHSFAASHPQFARALGRPSQSYSGGNMSTYALAMGYNVITDRHSGYVVVIDRTAMICRESDN